jgi:hypothetical protein
MYLPEKFEGVQLSKQFTEKVKNNKLENKIIYYSKIRVNWEYFKICRGRKKNSSNQIESIEIKVGPKIRQSS